MVYGLKETYEIYQTNSMYMDLFGSRFDQNNSLYEYSSLYLQMFNIFLNKTAPKNVSGNRWVGRKERNKTKNHISAFVLFQDKPTESQVRFL